MQLFSHEFTQWDISNDRTPNGYQVYFYIFPNNKKYVGCTGTTIKKRQRNYINEEMSHYIKNNNYTLYVTAADYSQDDALELETKLIKELRTFDAAIGYNQTIKSHYPVQATNIKTGAVKYWRSIQAAYRDLAGKSHSLIERCLHGERKTAYGYKNWAFI